MKNIDLGQTIGVLANLGVLVGIVFLAIEIRQNNESLEESRNLAIAQANQQKFVALDESYRSLANSAYLPAIFQKYDEQGIEALSPEEFRRLLWQSCSGMYRLASAYSWAELGFGQLDPNFRQVVINFLPRWEDLGIAPLDESFRAEVDRIIREAGLAITLPQVGEC